jgi:hypothetical protein
MDIHWIPACTTNPYIQKLIKHENNTIIFDGHFYLEDEVMPIKRIMYVNDTLSLVEITSKKTMDNTSSYFYDEDVGQNICLFPTNVIEIQYNILKEIASSKELNKLQSEIIADEEEIRDRNTNFRRKREDEEYKKSMETWKLNYKEYLKDCIPDDDKK